MFRELPESFPSSLYAFSHALIIPPRGRCSSSLPCIEGHLFINKQLPSIGITILWECRDAPADSSSNVFFRPLPVGIHDSKISLLYRHR